MTTRTRKTIKSFFASSILAVAAVAGCQSSSEPVAMKSAQFGEPMKLQGDAMDVSQVLASVDQRSGQHVRVTGSVAEVCQKKGCWINMSDGREKLFVKFTCPIEGRLIPVEAVGKTVIAEGTLMVEEVSEADARHMAEEGGASAEAVAAIVGPQKQITLASPSALVIGVER